MHPPMPSQFPPLPELPFTPSTLTVIAAAIEGYRNQLDVFAAETSANLRLLRDQLQYRIDVARAFQ